MDNRNAVRRLTIRNIARAKGGEPIVGLPAYTAPVARIVDEACRCRARLRRRHARPARHIANTKI